MKRGAKKGIFITLEGIDGCGKSTQARLLARALRRLGHDVLLTREPGGTALGRKLRRVLLHPDSVVSGEAELFLYLADRAQHVEEVVAPALEAGRLVLSERYADSTVAYQGAGRGLSAARVKNLNRIATRDIMPDLTLLLDIAPALARRRKANHPAPADRLERLERSFHNKLAAEYRRLAAAEPRRFRLIKATGSIEQVHESIMRALKEARPALVREAPSPQQRRPKQ